MRKEAALASKSKAKILANMLGKGDKLDKAVFTERHVLVRSFEASVLVPYEFGLSKGQKNNYYSYLKNAKIIPSCLIRTLESLAFEDELSSTMNPQFD